MFYLVSYLVSYQEREIVVSIIGRRIRKLRKEVNMRQKDLAEKIGYSRTTIANYETDIRIPNIEVLCTLADLFNVSIDYIVGRTNIREQNYQLLIEKQDSIILLINPANGRIMDCSLKAARFYGYPRKKLLNMNIDNISLAKQDELTKMMKQAVSNEKNEFQTVHKLADGKDKKVKVYSGPIFIDQQKHLLYIISDTESSNIARENIATTISTITSSRTPFKIKHKYQVANISKNIACKMGLSADLIENIYISALLHDIGFITIPVEIINKPDSLNKVEFEMIKTHPEEGAKIIEKINNMDTDIAENILQHHERIDGSGYPHGLKYNKIHIGARILAVADVLEAMTSDRPYRKALGIQSAIKELNTNKGIKYDSNIVNICTELYHKNKLF